MYALFGGGTPVHYGGGLFSSLGRAFSSAPRGMSSSRRFSAPRRMSSPRRPPPMIAPRRSMPSTQQMKAGVSRGYQKARELGSRGLAMAQRGYAQLPPEMQQQLGEAGRSFKQQLQQAAIQTAQAGLARGVGSMQQRLGLPPAYGAAALPMVAPQLPPQLQQCASLTASVPMEQKAAALQSCLAMLQQFQQTGTIAQ